jgi:hypothetical protein
MVDLDGEPIELPGSEEDLMEKYCTACTEEPCPYDYDYMLCDRAREGARVALMVEE